MPPTTSKQDLLRRIRAYNAAIRGDAEPLEEEALEIALPVDEAIEQESIVMRKRRPVLAIKQGTAELEFRDEQDGAIWKPVLLGAKKPLEAAIAAVGRIELQGNPDFSWVGTGWVVHDQVLVTNRHVAEVFSEVRGGSFVFQPGIDADMQADVDFLQEIGRSDQALFQVKRVLYIEPRPGPDLAFLELSPDQRRLAAPIVLSGKTPAPNPLVATIGYPAFDSRVPEPDLMAAIYGQIYDKKRLAPGAITEVQDSRVLHNCTTLGGNSGSVVVDLATGEALALHFSGSFLRTNYGVRADVVRERLDALLKGSLSAPSERPRPTTPRRPARPAPAAPRSAAPGNGGHAKTVTIPLVISVSLGDVDGGQREPTRGAVPRLPSFSRGDEDTETEARATPEDYADRIGFRTDFLGGDFPVALPEVVQGASDVLTFDGGQQELKYEHFSVVMNRRRRMCFFSACNVDGARSKSSRRKAWRLDPRIPDAMQIIKECYGNAPKFSRGHMTRREDPAWGTSTAIQRGSDDSMHVTNATPQMQSFNSPIWLALEDYALEHAREDDMKISVITGPYLEKADPILFGVRVPVEFWKVIAFIHDETGELCATGYEMSQRDNLEQPEFVFGDFVSPQLNMSTQVSIASIEAKAGISFGGLADFDPLGLEGLDDLGGALTRLEQIRFV